MPKLSGFVLDLTFNSLQMFVFEPFFIKMTSRWVALEEFIKSNNNVRTYN